jgi:hypothetical protein
MSTAYYRVDTEELLGVRTFEKAGSEKPRQCFTWATNPALYLWDAKAHLIRDEYGTLMERDYWLRKELSVCKVQKYDEENIPA